MAAQADALLDFWFGDTATSSEALAERVPLWFAADPGFDRAIRERFADLPERALAGELDDWRDTAPSTLALVIALDQLPRNLHRGSAQAFAYDARALEIARAALDAGRDAELAPVEATFVYLPFEHAESLADQDRCVALFEALCARCDDDVRPTFDSFVDYATRHREVIRQFGRFPHRNSVLGRRPTPEETAYLEAGGADFSGSQLEEDD